MKDTNIQWHPGFVAAMELELKEYREHLVFNREYNLNTKPLQIDLLVVKKDSGIEITNDIGRIFKGHNIMEFKSPDDSLNIDTFHKTTAYAGLYKAYGENVDERKAEDITVSIVRERKPKKLLDYFKQHGIKVTMPYKGIYYVHGFSQFQTQIITCNELDMQTHTWIKALSEKLKEADMEILLEKTGQLKNDSDRELADSILEVCLSANSSLVEKIKGDGKMGEILMEIVAPLLKEKEIEWENKGRLEGRLEGEREGRLEGERKGRLEGERKGKIIGMVDALHDLGYSDREIKTLIMEKHHLMEKEADKYLQR